MAYFENFPVRYYKVGDDYVLVPSIHKRVKLSDITKASATAFSNYNIKDSDKPDIIADKLYDDSQLYWIVFMVNDIVDYYNDWPLSSNELDAYCIRKYGINEVHSLHHYEDLDGHTVDLSHPDYDRKAISNYQYELDINESKRNIRLLLPQYVDQLLTEVEEKLGE